MARTLNIPLGKLSEDQIIPGMDAATEAIASAMKRQFGTEGRIETETVAAQNEVKKDNKSVALKVVRKIVKYRKGLFSGVNSVLKWHRDRPEEVQVELSNESVFLEWSFIGTFVVAAIITVIYCVHIDVIGDYITGAMFLAVWLILLIPFQCLSYLLSIPGRGLLDSVEHLVRDTITASK